MKKRSDSLVIRDRPWGARMFGLIFAVAGVGFAFLGNPKSPDLAVGAPIFVIGMAFLLFSSDLTLRIDRRSGRLRLTYESLLTWEIKTLKLDEIAAVDIESTTSDKGRLYRVVIVDDKGRATPLRNGYSNGYENHAALASQLRKLTGVGGSDGKAMDVDETIAALTGQHGPINQQIQARQEALTGPNARTREHSGVRWKLQSRGMGRVPVTRWFSTDFKLEDSFVFVAQKPPGQALLNWMLGKFTARTAMRLYGFVGGLTPNADRAELVPLDPRLSETFVAFSPDPALAQKLLGPSVTGILADWAARHPLRGVRVGIKTGQLVLLYSPAGTHAATMGNLDPIELDELTAVGVALVKAQVGLT